MSVSMARTERQPRSILVTTSTSQKAASSFQTWAPGDAAPEVGGGGVVDVLAGHGPAARLGVLAEDAELRLWVLILVDRRDAGVEGGPHPAGSGSAGGSTSTWPKAQM